MKEYNIQGYLPRYIFLTKGIGRHKEKLASFERALRDAKIAPFNLVKVSSIFPPGCKFISVNEGLNMLKHGQIVFCVMSENATDEPHRLLGASVGLAIPADNSQYGYLSEYHSYGEPDEKMGLYSEYLATEMLANILGIDFDTEKTFDEQKKEFKLSGKIIRTTNITQTAIGHKDGLWTSVVAAAILI